MEDKGIIITKITDGNRGALFKLILSTYLGEKCKHCLKEFKTLDDLEDAVFAGYHKHRRIAHKKCWDENSVA